ncbi:hypothetical protein LDENG_00263160, partial [Lucifuga dentata]
MSLQICHCGWSKVTTYQGLRIHQGKMECTPKGMSIPKSQQFKYNRLLLGNLGLPAKLNEPWLDVYIPVKGDSSSDTSLQICHCGWSKVTTYQGLRIHQGKMECTPKGMRIPKSEQSMWKNWRKAANDEDDVPVYAASIMKENEPVLPSFNTQINPAAATVKQEPRSYFETPQHSFQMAKNVETVRRTLNFSLGLKDQKLTFEVPSATSQETAVRRKEKFREDQQFSQTRRNKIITDLKLKCQMREQKLAEVRSSVKACKGSLDREWLEINSVFSEVMKVVEEARQKALQPLEKRRARAKKEAQDLIQELQREIDKLKQSISELVSPLTWLDESRDWKKITLDTSSSLGTLRMTTSTMIEQIHHKLEKLSLIDLKRISKFAVDVKLDLRTAHRHLILSDDGKQVRDGGKIQEVADAPERFDLFASLLAVNTLTSGKSYWEVEVNNKTGWDLGVARGNANRRGKLSMNPDNGFWVTVHYNDKEYAAMTEPPVRLSLKTKPEKVGVFVDYDEGIVSFYDVKAKSHIYSFTGCSFSDEIFPYFSPHLKQDG